MAKENRRTDQPDDHGLGKSEGYARSTLPSNRWGLFWDILKGSWTRLLGVNLLILLFLSLWSWFWSIIRRMLLMWEEIRRFLRISESGIRLFRI